MTMRHEAVIAEEFAKRLHTKKLVNLEFQSIFAAEVTPPVELIVAAEIVCPHCGEGFPMQIDTSQSEQSFIEDCTICCRPIGLTIRCEPGLIVDLAIGDV
jgi:Cysteine-rich CPXCG